MLPRHVERCLRCRYARVGLPRDVACPECGEPAPPADWVVLFGSGAESEQWGGQAAAGGVLILTGLALAALTYFRLGGRGTIAPAIAILSAGGYILWRSYRTAQRTGEGGDIVWILRPEAIEMRSPLLTRTWRWEEIGSALFGYGWRKHLVQLTLFQPSPGAGPEANIWVNERDVDARAVHQLLRERIAAAKPPRPLDAEAIKSTVNPPASPRPGPS